MADDIAISLDHVTKTYKLRASGVRTLKASVLDFIRGRSGKREFTALKEANFTVRRGEVMGIIGANGAGKSTLLSLITGTTPPTTGTIKTQGTISSLLELGAGFHPDLTGRENVYLYGAVIGLSRRQMRERFESIVDFAGIREFIDQPVKHYSSGMYVRLGFSVAVEVDPDILLIDEVLSVGDTAFQQKCIQKMNEFRERSKTMLIVSHDLKTIQSISDRILLLDQGRIVGVGDPGEVISEYQAMARRRNAKLIEREWGTGDVKITGVEFLDKASQPTTQFQFGEPLEARISYRAEHRIEQPVFGFALSDEAGRVIFGSNTHMEGLALPFVEGAGVLSLRIERLPMARGTYRMSFSCHTLDHKINFHRLDNRYSIDVECSRPFEGYCHMPIQWRHGH